MSASRPNVEGDKAVLALPPIQANSAPTCSMRFYYHMIGSHVGKLTVFKRNYVGFRHVFLFQTRFMVAICCV